MGIYLLKKGIKRKNTFKFSIITTGANETFTLPLLAETHNFTVNWGDGTADNTITVYNDVNRIHTYASAGTYVISMWGVCTAFAFNNTGDRLKVRELLDFVDMGFTTLNFYGCANLIYISSNFKRLKSLTTAGNLFCDCSSLTTIPQGMFDNCTLITSFNRAFTSCTSVVAIPVDLFKYNVLNTGFNYLFYNCSLIPEIPIDLFRYNVSVTSASYVFNGCYSVATIPEHLFRYNTLITNFNGTFNACRKVQFNRNIFFADGEEGTRFLNKSVNFTSCFNRPTFTGVQGEAPQLWNCNFGTGTPNKTTCFGGAGNSITSLSNYNDIPVEWK